MQSAIDDGEWNRLQKLMIYEKSARLKGFQTIAGIDEAGRGPLAGPVVAAVCVIPEGIVFPGVNDSKQLTPKKREQLYQDIISNENVVYSIAQVSSYVIDQVNIYQATVRAMLEALKKLKCKPDILFVDGMQLKHPKIPCEKIVQGDAKSQSIAAASILAKETRDRLMREFHELWPVYGFGQHKGYGTEQHLQALREHGPCPIHRMTFEPLKTLFPKESQQMSFL